MEIHFEIHERLHLTVLLNVFNIHLVLDDCKDNTGTYVKIGAMAMYN